MTDEHLGGPARAALDPALFERLSAYVDDEVSQDERRTIEARAAEEPDIAAALAELAALKTRLQRAYVAPSGDEVERRLAALLDAPTEDRPDAVDTDNVTRLWNRDGRTRRWWPAAASLAAASVAALALFLGPAIDPGSDDSARHIALGPIDGNSALAETLFNAAYGESRADGSLDWTPRGVFADGAERVCREFQAHDGGPQVEIGLACFEEGAWNVEFAALAPIEAPDASSAVPDYASPASGPGLDALGLYMEKIGAGLQLTAEEEAVFLNDWRAARGE